MRTFIAVGLPQEIRASLAALQRALAGSGADVKWVESQNLHVTLAFLGEITPPQQRDLEAALRRLASATAPFDARVSQLGAFPSWNAARVIWVGIEPGREPLAALADQITQATNQLGLRKELRPFAAHLTLGRVRSMRGLRELSEAVERLSWQPPAPWTVSSVTLYQSQLSARGPTYSVLANVPLGG